MDVVVELSMLDSHGSWFIIYYLTLLWVPRVYLVEKVANLYTILFICTFLDAFYISVQFAKIDFHLWNVRFGVCVAVTESEVRGSSASITIALTFTLKLLWTWSYSCLDFSVSADYKHWHWLFWTSTAIVPTHLLQKPELWPRWWGWNTSSTLRVYGWGWQHRGKCLAFVSAWHRPKFSSDLLKRYNLII